MPDEVQTGVVRKLIVDKGRPKFGFISRTTAEGTAADLFFYSDRVLDATVPVPRDAVVFRVGEDDKGRPMAVDVRRITP